MDYHKKIILNNKEDFDYFYSINKNSNLKNINIIKIKNKVNELLKKINFCEKIQNNYDIEVNLSETLILLDKINIKINNIIINNGKINKYDKKNIEYEF